MITIKLYLSIHVFRYKGNIKLTVDGNYLLVSADEVVRLDDFPISSGHTWDMFFVDEIVSITGE